MQETKVLIKYISVWGWQILALLFLVSSFFMFALPRTLITQSFYVSFFLIFVICEYFVLIRKREIYNEIE